MKKYTLFAFAVLASTAFAQDVTLVATGDKAKGSTYAQMFDEFNARCGNVVSMKEVPTTGSIQNVDLLTSNKVNAAVVQSDMLFLKKLTDEEKVANVRTLFALHPEELHFIARGDTQKEGGFGIGSMRVGGKEVTYNTFDDLKGRTVGAVGGSVASARVVAAQSGLNFNVKVFETNDEMLKALQSGAIDSILVVAGAPSKMVSELDARFKLLPVSPAMQKTLSAVYSPAKIGYTKLNAGQPIQTISTQALFVTRTYRSKDTQLSLSTLRTCFYNQLPNIQDATGTHPKWQVVDAEKKGSWTWYDLPETARAVKK